MARILLVDESSIFRKLESSILGWRNHNFCEASNVEEAWEIIESDPPDVILTNLNLKDENGLNLCQKVKQDPNLESIPVIVITASKQKEAIQEAVNSGCNDYLTKPLNGSALISKVDEHLGKLKQRKFPRIPVSLQISFEDFKGIFFEYSRDLSRAGIFVEMENPLPIGSQLHLSFSLPPPFSHPVTAWGNVVRREEASKNSPGGVGIRFIWLDPDSERIIDAMVAGQTDNAIEENSETFSQVSLQEETETDQTLAADRLSWYTLKQDHLQLSSQFSQLQHDHQQLCTKITLQDSLSVFHSPEKLLSTALDLLEDIIGARASAVFFYNQEQNNLQLAKAKNLPAEMPEALAPEGPLEKALSEKQLQIPSPTWRISPASWNILAAVPITFDDQVLGVITVFELVKQKHSLNTYDHQSLTTLSNQLGQALIGSINLRPAEQRLGVKDLIEIVGNSNEK
jgi:uncharacterized protein (TIGR02266 family)